MVKRALLVGAGGHCRVLLSILRYEPEFSVVGIADRNTKHTEEKISGIPIKYTWNQFREIRIAGIDHGFVAIGDNRERTEIFNELRELRFRLPSIIHPTAIIETDAIMGEGNQICMGVRISTMVRMGSNCVVYTGTTIDHEVVIGDNAYISPGCSIAGRVSIESGAYIGIGSCIKENVTIGRGSTIGAGSVVLENVLPNAVVAGVPAKVLDRNR